VDSLSKLRIEEANANTYSDGTNGYVIPEGNVDAACEKLFPQWLFDS